jgi:ABC-type bacteriocin/lantibiotic exporter with double-glycine peptidase domain
VRFDKVSLRYAQGAAPALLGVGFAVEPGQLFGITGRSSSGKSSILKVLLGLYAPQSGQAFLDGVDVRQIDVQTLRRTVSYAPQETRLFHGTIRQNLLLGHPMASEAEIFDALRATRMHDLIESLPKGLDTRIGDEATARLPRGFARRLTIARALVRPSDVLLLDEPEQALDDDGEEMLVDLLRDLKGRKTVILVTHRPRYLRLADAVAVVAEGSVKAAGPAEAVLEAAKNAVNKGEPS